MSHSFRVEIYLLTHEHARQQGLLESSVPRQGSRVMMFIAGPATIGAGIIVNRSKKESIRSHNDLIKNQAPLFKPAVEFYKGLSDRAIANCIVVDVFACSLDQVHTCIREHGCSVFLYVLINFRILDDGLSTNLSQRYEGY